MPIKPKEPGHARDYIEIIDPEELAQNLRAQARVDEEYQRAEGIDYDEQHVRQATVHSHEDLVVVASNLSSVALYLRYIAKQVPVVVMLLATIAAVLVAPWLL